MVGLANVEYAGPVVVFAPGGRTWLAVCTHGHAPPSELNTSATVLVNMSSSTSTLVNVSVPALLDQPALSSVLQPTFGHLVTDLET